MRSSERASKCPGESDRWIPREGGPLAPKRRLGELLTAAGLIDEFQLHAALADQAKRGRPLGTTLIALGFIGEEDMLGVLGHQLKTPISQLPGLDIPEEVLELVPLEVAEKYHCIPIFVRDGAGVRELHLGMSDPTDLSALDDIGSRTGMAVYPVLVLHGQLEDAINRHYRGIEPALHPTTGDPARFLTRQETATPKPEGQRTVELSPVRASDADSRAGAGPSTRAVLRALVQLLIDKGILERDDLANKLRHS